MLTTLGPCPRLFLCALALCLFSATALAQETDAPFFFAAPSPEPVTGEFPLELWEPTQLGLYLRAPEAGLSLRALELSLSLQVSPDPTAVALISLTPADSNHLNIGQNGDLILAFGECVEMGSNETFLVAHLTLLCSQSFFHASLGIGAAAQSSVDGYAPAVSTCDGTLTPVAGSAPLSLASTAAPLAQGNATVSEELVSDIPESAFLVINGHFLLPPYHFRTTEDALYVNGFLAKSNRFLYTPGGSSKERDITAQRFQDILRESIVVYRSSLLQSGDTQSAFDDWRQYFQDQPDMSLEGDDGHTLTLRYQPYPELPLFLNPADLAWGLQRKQGDFYLLVPPGTLTTPPDPSALIESLREGRPVFYGSTGIAYLPARDGNQLRRELETDQYQTDENCLLATEYPELRYELLHAAPLLTENDILEASQ